MKKKIMNLINAIKENQEVFIINEKEEKIVKVQYISEEIDMLSQTNFKSTGLKILEENIEYTTDENSSKYSFIKEDFYIPALNELETEIQICDKTFKASYKLKHIQREVFVGSLIEAITLLHSVVSEYEHKLEKKISFKEVMDKFNDLISGKLESFYYSPFDMDNRYNIRFWFDDETEQDFEKRIEEAILLEIESLKG